MRDNEDPSVQPNSSTILAAKDPESGKVASPSFTPPSI